MTDMSTLSDMMSGFGRGTRAQELARVPLDQRPSRMTGKLSIRFPKGGNQGFFVGYIVADDYKLDIKDNWHAPNIPVVGETGIDVSGAVCTLIGKWSEHPRFGEQFKVHSILVTDTRQAEEMYIMSGALNGMKQALAARFIKAYPEGSLFDHVNHEDLQKVKGIGPTNSTWMMKSWDEFGTSAHACALGLAAGLSLRQSKQAWDKWGEDMQSVIKDQPYELTRLDGMTFQMADRIAIEQGHPRDSMDRYIAGTIEVLERAKMRGHTCLPTRPMPPYDDGVWPELVKLLGGDTQFSLWKDWIINNKICLACARRIIFNVDRCTHCNSDELELDPERRVDVIHDEEQNIIFLADRELHDMEKVVASDVSRLVSAPIEPIPEKHMISEPMIDVLAGKGFTPSWDQIDAIKMIASHNLFVLTGGPGTGKTTTLRIVLDYIENVLGWSTLCMAPTGKAADRMKEATGREAMTIHRALEWGPMGFGVTRGHPFSAAVVVVDESSMIDMEIAHSLMQAIDSEEMVEDGDRIIPVGKRCKILLVGDADQLPPVGPGQFFRDLVESGHVPVARLETVHRQAAKSGIVYNAKRIIQGKPLKHRDDRGQLFPDYVWIDHDNDRTLAARVVELVTEDLPSAGIDPDSLMILSPVRSIMAQCNKALQAALNPNGLERQFGRDLFLRTSDPVRHTKNNYDLQVFNGMTGQIVYMMGEEEEKNWRDNHSSMEPPKVVWVKYPGTPEPILYDRAQAKQLILAYACTIHSSQGSEWANVLVINLNRYIKGFTTRELVYTGATRAKKNLVMLGHPNAQEIIQRADARSFRHGLFRPQLDKEIA